MPELPEVESTRKDLVPILENKRIEDVQVNRFDLRVPVPKDFQNQVCGKIVTKLSRRGKYLLWHLNSGQIVIIHLGMSGRIRVLQPDSDTSILKHDHIIWQTKSHSVIYHDPRRFGLVVLSDEEALNKHPLFVKMGIEPFGSGLTKSYLQTKYKNSKQNIKTMLLDQRIVVGIGNIYASEILYEANIDPRRICSSLNVNELSTLTQVIPKVLDRAITAGGSTLRDYARPSGTLGNFQEQFAVYSKTGKNCPNCNCKIGIQQIVQNGRSTFFCGAFGAS